MNTKRTGTGTVIHTMYEELFTPFQTQKKMRNQVAKVARRALEEKIVPSPVSYGLHPSGETNLITLTLKNSSALDWIYPLMLVSLKQSKSVLDSDHGRGFENAETTYTKAQATITL